ncbi:MULTISPECIES: hypothetical protein [unclassified Mesorhizobium]|uniref:hypothetical protein n=1 Tax=unclassified Mesorhizobium TaxID=325217 RepID=UPI0012E390F2|nr:MULTISPECIES: hypothetical protein [unclassified Mesorhizobium]MDR7034738.1 hypothetical protein [Mesorhizobium sp. BE184]
MTDPAIKSILFELPTLLICNENNRGFVAAALCAVYPESGNKLSDSHGCDMSLILSRLLQESVDG